MRILAALLLSCCVTLTTVPALAQFYLDTPKGYKLAAASGQGGLSLAAGDPIRSLAGECLGIQLDGVFRLQGGMSSYFEFDRGASKLVVREFALTCAGGRATGSQRPAQTYVVDGDPVYIAFGTTDGGGYEDCVVASVTGDASGVSEISRFSLGAQYCGGIYALDLTGDGSIDLAVPYATGAGGGGGIEVRTVRPGGRLAWFGNDELDSTLFSQTGYINLLDYDADGDWEIETSAPVLCSACGYMWHDLYTFDTDGQNWETDETRFAAYYNPQRDFYRALNDAVVKLAANPASMKYSGSAIESDYATQVGGQWYTLDPFMGSNGKTDRTWVNALASLVSGWK